NRPGMLWAKVVTSPYARAEIVSIDLSAASAMRGVKATWKDTELKEVKYAGQIVAAIAAETEEIAVEAAQNVKVEYKGLEQPIRTFPRTKLRSGREAKWTKPLAKRMR